MVVLMAHDLPPYVVYKGKNLWARWMKDGPAGCLYSVSDSGWMESANFQQWFSKLFVAAVMPMTMTAPVVLFFDGHHSHISLKLIEVARSNNIHLVCFPPHVTHLIQPLDVSAFGPVKNQWRKCLKAYQIKSRASTITKEEFPRLLDELYEKSFLPQHFRSGFRKCGLHPLCREAISLSKLSKALRNSKPSKPEVNNSSIEPEVVLDFKGTVTVAKTTTPIRFQLRGYFAQLLQAKKPSSKSTDKRKVKPKFYGEALTTDDVFQRFEEEETRKEEEKKTQALRKEIRELPLLTELMGKEKLKLSCLENKLNNGGRKKYQSSIMIVILLAVIPQRKTMVFVRSVVEFMPMMIKEQKKSGWVVTPVIDGITLTV